MKVIFGGRMALPFNIQVSKTQPAQFSYYSMNIYFKKFCEIDWFPGWFQHENYNKQPNDDGLSNQDCIELRRYFRTPHGTQTHRNHLTNTFMWNDRDCNAKNYLICEKAIDDG